MMPELVRYYFLRLCLKYGSQRSFVMSRKGIITVVVWDVTQRNYVTSKKAAVEETTNQAAKMEMMKKLQN